MFTLRLWEELMMITEEAFEHVRIERVGGGVARVVLARPERRNAQNKRLLYEVNHAFDVVAHDDDVNVVILAADGPHFSSGHDLADETAMAEFEPVGCWGGFDLPGAEGLVALEEELFVGLCWRWRNMPKPTIAQVQGKVIAGGLMLVWPCDLIVASSDATFSDPVVAFGVNGHEYFVHPWELGHRKAKEFLFTGQAIGAEEAESLGMVNRVVARADLEAETLALAERIASQPSMGLKLAKQSVNQALDNQGMWNTIQAAYGLHALGHSHNAQLYGSFIHPDGAATIRRLSRDG